MRPAVAARRAYRVAFHTSVRARRHTMTHTARRSSQRPGCCLVAALAGYAATVCFEAWRERADGRAWPGAWARRGGGERGRDVDEAAPAPHALNQTTRTRARSFMCCCCCCRWHGTRGGSALAVSTSWVPAHSLMDAQGPEDGDAAAGRRGMPTLIAALPSVSVSSSDMSPMLEGP
jgi:hypothetical protein